MKAVNLRSKLGCALLVVLLAGPITFCAHAANASAEAPATTDISWLRLASYVGQRYGPLLVELVSELLEHFAGDGHAAPPPPPPPSGGDPPIGDPEYAP